MFSRYEIVAFLAIFSVLSLVDLTFSHDNVNRLDPEELAEFRKWQEWKKFKKHHHRPSTKEEEDSNSIVRMHKNEKDENKKEICFDDRSIDRQFGPMNRQESLERADGKQDYEREKKEYRDYDKKHQAHKKHGKNDNKKHNKYEKIDGYRNKNDKEEGSESDPPPVDQAALMARYIVNQEEWTSVATLSSRKETENYPFVNIVSFSDGPLGNGSGVPYMYLTPLDFTGQDIYKDNRATLMMTLAQGRYCDRKNFDPMDPRCARISISGKIKAIRDDNPEIVQAKNAVFSRHPWLAHMPPDHDFFFAKLKINSIAVVDTFGGPKYVPVRNYFHPNASSALTSFDIERLEESSSFGDLMKSGPTVINLP